MSSLVDRAHAQFCHYNKTWLKMLFRDFTFHEMRLRENEAGHRYVVKNATLNTRLGRWGAGGGTLGAICGDNGGRTTKGTPCKKKAVADGRCAHHPPPRFEVIYDAGHTVSELEIDVGEDAFSRPIPWELKWSAVVLRVQGEDQTLSAIDHITESIELLSGTRVWSIITLELKKALNLPPEAHVHIGQRVYGADPLWTVKDLCKSINLPTGSLGLNGHRLEDGMLLEDYGLRPGKQLHLRIMCSSVR